MSQKQHGRPPGQSPAQRSDQQQNNRHVNSSTQPAYDNSRTRHKQQSRQQQQSHPRHAAKSKRRHRSSRYKRQLRYIPVQTIEEFFCEGEEHSADPPSPHRVSKSLTRQRERRYPSPTRAINDLTVRRRKFIPGLPPVRESKGTWQECHGWSLIVQPWELNPTIAHRYDLFCKFL